MSIIDKINALIERLQSFKTITVFFPFLEPVEKIKNSITTMIDSVGSNNDAIKDLPTLKELSPDNALMLQTEEEIAELRKNIFLLASNAAHSEEAKQAHKVLLRLAEIMPLNATDPILFEDIEIDDKVFIASGNQFSLSNLIRWHNSRSPGRKDRNLFRGDHNKFLLNPLTNQPFELKDEEHILQIAEQRGLQILNFISMVNYQEPHQIEQHLRRNNGQPSLVLIAEVVRRTLDRVDPDLLNLMNDSLAANSSQEENSLYIDSVELQQLLNINSEQLQELLNIISILLQLPSNMIPAQLQLPLNIILAQQPNEQSIGRQGRNGQSPSGQQVSHATNSNIIFQDPRRQQRPGNDEGEPQQNQRPRSGDSTSR